MLKQSYQKLWRVATNGTTGVEGEVSAKEYYRIHRRTGVEKDERMRMRQTMKKGNKTATARMEEAKRNQCSADTLSHSSEDSLNHFSHYNTAFPSYFTTST